MNQGVAGGLPEVLQKAVKDGRVVAFCITEKSLRGLEVKNMLPKGSLLSAKWIKPIAKRSEGQ